MNNKFYLMITIVGCVAILTIGGLFLNQIYKNHLANEIIIEKCFENFEDKKEVVIKQDGFWSQFTCEKNYHHTKIWRN